MKVAAAMGEGMWTVYKRMEETKAKDLMEKYFEQEAVTD